MNGLAHNPRKAITMKRITALLLLVVALPSAAAQWTSRIDLTRVLNDPALLHRLTVFYTTPERPGQILHIHGDGTLLLQQIAYPARRVEQLGSNVHGAC